MSGVVEQTVRQCEYCSRYLLCHDAGRTVLCAAD